MSASESEETGARRSVPLRAEEDVGEPQSTRAAPTGSEGGLKKASGSDGVARFDIRDPNPGLLRRLLYGLYDGCWLLAALIGAPYLLWRSWRRPGFGAGVLERMGKGLERVPPKTRPRVLVHGVSVGEVKAASSVVARLEELYPELEIVISTTTDTGIEVARAGYPGRSVVRFPADLSFCVRRFLKRVAPDLVVLVELEIWPNFLRHCNRSGRPVAVINGRITEISHARYFVFRKLLPEFNRISFFCVQSEEYAERFRHLDVEPERILVTGNVKFDGLRALQAEPDPEQLKLFGGEEGQRILVAGSTHEPEERFLVEAWREAVPHMRLILVPRHPNRKASICAELEALGAPCQTLSSLRARTEKPDPKKPLLVDTIGELERLYGLADLVFVGGSLIPHGGQNMLEPAGQARPCVFGPHLKNFSQEAALLLEARAALCIKGQKELASALARLEADEQECEAMGQRGLEAVRSQRGATELTAQALARLGLADLARKERSE